jgi:hypothetical protein
MNDLSTLRVDSRVGFAVSLCGSDRANRPPQTLLIAKVQSPALPVPIERHLDG